MLTLDKTEWGGQKSLFHSSLGSPVNCFTNTTWWPCMSFWGRLSNNFQKCWSPRPRTCDCVTLCALWDREDLIKLQGLRWERFSLDYLGVPVEIPRSRDYSNILPWSLRHFLFLTIHEIHAGSPVYPLNVTWHFTWESYPQISQSLPQCCQFTNDP